MNRLIRRLTFGQPLIGCALSVAVQHKKLILFPLLSMVCLVGVVLFFVSPLALWAAGSSLVRPGSWPSLMVFVGPEYWPMAYDRVAKLSHAYTYPYAVGLYLAGMFTATFLSVAFCHEIMRALSGDSVSIFRGLAVACRRVRAILFWSMLACTVGLMIRAVQSRGGWWAMRLVGIAWSVASLFVIPVMLRVEETNPWELLRDSAATIKKSWGDAVFGYVGIASGALLLVCAWLAVVGVAVLLAAWLGSGPLVVLALAGGLLGTMGIFYLSAVAQSIHVCALYVYATEGVVPAPFPQAAMDAAWQIKLAPSV